MLYINILACVFIVMLSAPFASAIIYCKRKKGDILFIRQEKVKDARYFAKSFAKTFEEHKDKRKDGYIMLSKLEKFLAEGSQNVYPETLDKVVVCLDKDMIFHAYIKNYLKEIYAAYNIMNYNKGVSIRAICSKEKMVLADNTTIERWADAEETFAIYDNCDLGVSTTAGERLSIGRNCTFKRLYAKEILIGQYPQSIADPMKNRKPEIFAAAKELEVLRNIKTVDSDMANENGEIDATILTKHNLVVLEGLIVRGDICSHKEVRICDDAVVCGNLFAEEDIHIGRNATIIGNVFTQGSVYVEADAMLGKPGSISSIIARDNITFEKNVFVYGYVSSERGGKIIDSNMESETHEYKLLDGIEYLKELRFTDIEEFEKIDNQGYRKEKMLSKVDILVPAKAIMKSMFFSCKELKSVILPNTLEEIGPYAFADCEKLKDVTTFKGMRIKSIGTSAFENCKEIESIELPKTLEVLGGAAFAGCTNLKKVIFAEGCELTTIGSHVFRGCTSLEEIVIPDKVQIMDLSVFKDCTALKSVSIPMACQKEPAIQEIWENLDIHIDVRNTGI